MHPNQLPNSSIPELFADQPLNAIIVTQLARDQAHDQGKHDQHPNLSHS